MSEISESPTSAPEVEVRLFGVFLMAIDGKAAEKLSKSCQQLIALLILAGENGVERDFAAQSLWPESPLTTARYYFRRTLTECRKALGLHRDRLRNVLPTSVRFAPSPPSDYDRFEQLACSEDLEDLLTAIQISELEFLPGVRSTWSQTQRLKIRLKFQALCLKCAQLYRLQANFSRALDVLATAHAADPLDDEVLVPYWEALVELGQDDRFEESHRQTLERYARSRLEFSPRLASAARRLFKNERSAGSLALDVPQIENLPFDLAKEPPFVGRQNELKQVAALLKSNRVVEITGTPGIGVTRFVLEAAKAFRSPAIYVSERDIAAESVPTGRKCLLILDGHSPDEAAINSLLQSKPYLKILIGSSGLLPNDFASPISLRPLNSPNATNLLNFLLQSDPIGENEAEEIARRLVGNPAALTVAANYASLFGVGEMLRQLRYPKKGDLLVTQIENRVGRKWLAILCPTEQAAVSDLAEIPRAFPLDLARLIVSKHLDGPPDRFIVRKLFGLGVLISEPEGRVKFNDLLLLCLSQTTPSGQGRQWMVEYYVRLAASNPQPSELDLPLIESSVSRLSQSEPTHALRLLNWVGPAMARLGRSDELADLTHSFLPQLEPSSETVAAWMNVGLGYHRAHKLGLAACSYRIARGVAEELNLESETMQCLFHLGEVEANSAQLDDAELHLQEAAELARKLHDRGGEAFALRTLGYVKRQRHETEPAIQYTTKALALYTQLGDIPGRVWCIGCLASCYFETGAFEQARSRFLESLAIQRTQGDLHGIAWNLTYLGETSNFLGDLKQGEAYVREALALQQDPQFFRRLAWPLRILGENLVLQGDLKAAEATLCASLDSVRDSGNKIGEALTLIRLAEVSLAAEEPSTARAYLDLAEEIGKAFQNPQILDEAARVAAQIP